MTSREIAGKNVEFDDEGFMVDAREWTRDVAVALAKEEGIDPLTEQHWKVVDFCRRDFEERGESPTLRRITQAGGVSTKDIYQLFPKGPAKKVARISGLRKPTGCI